jgi:hypothetical protein
MRAHASIMKNGEPYEQENLGDYGSDVAIHEYGDFCTYYADATVKGAGFFGRKHKH